MNPRFRTFLHCIEFRIVIGALLVFVIPSSLLFVNSGFESPPIQWEKFFDGSRGCSVLQNENGDYLVTGEKGLASVLIGTDSSGNLLWTKTFQIEGKETFLPYLIQTADGGYALAGTWENNYALVRVDSEGNIIWTKTYERNALFNYLRSVIQTNDGGYALVGTYLNNPPSDGQTWFVKVDALGNIQWNKTIGSIGDFVNSVLQTSDGGYSIIGTSWASETSPARPKIIKTDPDGIVQWNKTYGGIGKAKFYYTESFSGIITDDGGYLSAGFAGESSSSWMAWLVKTDPQGKMIWNQTYGEIGSLVNSVINTRDGGYSFVGVVNRQDAWIAKTDVYGNMDWNLTFKGSSIETFCKSIIQTNDGGYAIVGMRDGRIWLVKITTLSQHSPVLTPLLETIVIVILAITLGITIVVFILSKSIRRKRGNGSFKFVYHF